MLLALWVVARGEQNSKVVFCRVRTNRTRRVDPGFFPTKNFCNFCRAFIPVPGTSRSSVRHSYLYPEPLEAMYARGQPFCCC